MTRAAFQMARVCWRADSATVMTTRLQEALLDQIHLTAAKTCT